MGDRKHKVRGDDPAFDEPKIQRGMRRLVIAGETWLWKFGNHVDIRDPQGKGHRVTLADLLGVTWDEVERAEHKRYLRVDPSSIVDHIQRAILGFDDVMGYPEGTPGHRHQAEPRKGWMPFNGPRGTWQAKLDPWIIEIHSPEDVKYEARANEVLGMTVDAWVDIKDRDLKAIGSCFDDLWKAEKLKAQDKQRHRIEVMMRYDAPSMPKPTASQLEDHVLRRIIGKAALGAARKAA